MRQLRIVMAQLNLMVGDIDGNTRQVLDAATTADRDLQADMVVFPELALSGYPPEDLLLRPSLKLRIDKALKVLLEAELKPCLVVGYPELVEGKLYNALVLIHRGTIVGGYRKQHLPNYQVFDEQRYFKPGSDPCVIAFAGTRIGFTICEDLWQPQPVAQAREAGARLLININASPYHMKKVQQRQSLLQQRSREGAMPIVYVNLAGGQDELVFDGASMAVNPDGDCSYLAPAFTTGLYPVAVEIDAEGRCAIPRQQVSEATSLEAEVYQALVMGVKDYVGKNRFKGTVLGLSGGIDSALTLAIAVDALGADAVHAVMMPFEFTSQLSLDVAAQQAESLGVKFSIISIAEIYESICNALAEEFIGTRPDVTEENIQARCRGVLLMAISNKKGSLVLTTGNKSEIAVGYSTLYGDMAGGFDVLKEVSKTLVYRLARYRNTLAGDDAEIIPVAVIERPPSAELAPGQLDQDSLPPYGELDRILELYVEQDFSAAAIIKEGFAEADVYRVLRLVDLNEYKRRQGPIGVRLTQRAFGRDRRYPITNAWPLGE
ncbi:MAG: NAD+ synthase [Gammaproteobacteria bacterium]